VRGRRRGEGAKGAPIPLRAERMASAAATIAAAAEQKDMGWVRVGKVPPPRPPARRTARRERQRGRVSRGGPAP
jgi:hypothetical protein